MKKTLLVIKMANNRILRFISLITLILTLNSLALIAQTPVDANGKLKVVGTQLVSETGAAVQLRGLSSHGLNWFTEDYNFNSLSVMANDWGIDVFRLAMYPTEQPDVTKGGYEGNPAFWKKYIDDLVDMCGQLGMYCIIDWHVLTPGDPSNSTYLPMAKDFWDYMSKKHAGKKYVLYEICNEPNGVDWATVKGYADQIIPIIRANDPSTVIIVGSPTWSSDVDIAANNPITGQTNIMYSFHFYAGSHTQSYRDKITTAISKGLAIFVTEWGTTTADGGGSVNTTESTTWLNFMTTNKISWCNWSYSDKNETSAVLVPYSAATNSWGTTSASGLFVKNAVQSPVDSWAGTLNKKPAANISSPLNGAYYLPSTAITITADAVDANGTVIGVDFYVDGIKIGSDASSPYSILWTPTTAKDYTLTAIATDNAAATGTSLAKTVHISSSITQTAYPDGTPWPIPGTLQSYNFDNGGEMIAYHDVDAVHKGPAGSLRSSEGVDIEGSANVGYTLNGEWLEYTVNVATAGTYDFTINAGSGYPITGKLHLEFNGVAKTVVTDIPSTNAWGSYQPIKISGIQLSAGIQVMRLVFDRGYFNFTSMSFAAVTTPPTITLTAPASNLSVAQGTPITLSATAADSDGSISKVEFYAGTSKIGEDLTSPYSISWTPQLEGVYTISAIAYDNMLSTATSTSVSVTVTSNNTPPTTPNLALNKTATASSIETTSFPASNAVDGSTGTRWASLFADPQWLQVDLQTAQTINRVILNWEAAYATTYQIQVSSNATTWTTVASIVGGNGSIDDIIFTDVSARYVRMYGTERVTPYGYSLYEFEVYGTSGTNVPVTGITLSPATISINTGSTTTLTATILPSNATNKSITWTSSNTAIATVSSTGIVTGKTLGSAIITATTVDQLKVATSTISVINSDIPVTGVTVAPTSASVTIGGTTALVATVLPSNATDKSISWSSSNSAIATVNSAGVVTGIALGTATITVTTTVGTFKATSTISVINLNVPVTGVTLSPATVSMTVGGTSTLTATVLPSNATLKTVKWTSSNSAVASVNSAGIVSAISIGSAIITVTTDDGLKTATSVITVVGTPTPCTTPTAIGLPIIQKGVGEYCWSTTGTINFINSWNMDMVEVNGVDFTNVWSNTLPAKIDGKYYIHYKSLVSWASLEVNGSSGDSSISVTAVSVAPTTTNMNIGGTATLIATVLPSNASNKSVTWSSSNSAIASVNTTGIVTGVALGSATITVTTLDGNKQATSIVTVGTINTPVVSVSVTPDTITINTGSSTTLTATITPTTATNKSIIWSSSNISIATVSTSGVVFGVSSGIVTITATTVDGAKTDASTITVKGVISAPCSNPVTITIPYSKDNIGEYCWVTTQAMAFVNSWNTDLIEINGVDFTNKWSNNIPAAIDGKWYIHYKASLSWAHFEAPALKDVSGISLNKSIDASIYPNPFNNNFIIELSTLDNLKSIQIYNQQGKLIQVVKPEDFGGMQISFGDDFKTGLYIIQVINSEAVKSYKIIKN